MTTKELKKQAAWDHYMRQIPNSKEAKKAYAEYVEICYTPDTETEYW